MAKADGDTLVLGYPPGNKEREPLAPPQAAVPSGKGCPAAARAPSFHPDQNKSKAKTSETIA